MAGLDRLIVGTDPDEYRKKLALMLTQSGLSTEPIRSHWQGAARLAQALVGGLQMQALRNEGDDDAQAITNILATGRTADAPATPSPAPQAMASALSDPGAGKTTLVGNNPDYGNAIASIESGGKYDALGPVTKTGDRAYGKYQVMGANVGPWTAQALGKAMTPEQFAADPAAQDKVFQQKFGSYQEKYGPEGAAKAWFAGERGMNNPNAKDQLGTSVADYAQKFNNALPQPTQVAAAGMNPQNVSPDAALVGGQNAAVARPSPNAMPQMAQAQMPGSRAQPMVPQEIQDRVQILSKMGQRGRAAALQLMQPYLTPKDQVRPMTQQERQAWGVPENMSAGIETISGKPIFSPPQTNVNLNTAQKGQEAMTAKAVEDFQNSQKDAREAQKRVAVWDAMEQAAKGFRPGATAELRTNAMKYLKDLGLTDGSEVPDAQVFQMLQKQLQIHSQPKGQGAVSNYERELFSQAVANMNQDPAALQRAIQISRKLDQFDQSVAKVYRENARKNHGVPNAVEINDEIDGLGSPLTPAEVTFLNNRKDKEPAAPAAAPTTPAPQAAPVPFTRDQIEEEMRRRGLLQ